MTLVDGDFGSIANPSGNHPQYQSDYDLFVSCHYEADLHVLANGTHQGGCFWGRAAASTTAAQDDRAGAVFWTRYRQLPGVPPEHFEWSNPNVTGYYAFQYTSATTPGILVEHGVGWGPDRAWLRDHVQDIANVWVSAICEFGGIATVPVATTTTEASDMTPAQEAKLDRVLAILEAREPLVWIARDQRGLDVETGKLFDQTKGPSDVRIKSS